MPTFPTDSDFHHQVDQTLELIESTIDASAEEIDSETSNGILTLSFDDGSKIIINRQAPLHELWVAARSGGFHFRFDGRDWRDTRSNETLSALLSRVISAQSGEAIQLELTQSV